MAPKNKRNSFFYFMKEMQQEFASRGTRLSMKEMADLAHPKWKAMTAAEKEPYERMTKKTTSDSRYAGKAASDGTSIEENFRKEEEKEKMKNRMIQSIKSYLNADNCTPADFKRYNLGKEIYILSFNLLADTETEFIPIEVGLVEYCIQEGIMREYHATIKTGNPPSGFAGRAKQLHENHQIPIYDDVGKESVDVVIENIEQFITNDEGQFLPVFTLDSDVEMNEGCLHWLQKNRSRRTSSDWIQVWDISFLLLELRNGIGDPLPTYGTAKDMLTKTTFNYQINSRCKFHEEMDMCNCALGYSNRLGYFISDAICMLFGVEMTNSHIPSQVAEDKNYEISAPLQALSSAQASATSRLSNGYGRGGSIHTSRFGVDDDFDEFRDSHAASSTRRAAFLFHNEEEEEVVARQPRTVSNFSLCRNITQLGLNDNSPSPGTGIGRGAGVGRGVQK